MANLTNKQIKQLNQLFNLNYHDKRELLNKQELQEGLELTQNLLDIVLRRVQLTYFDIHQGVIKPDRLQEFDKLYFLDSLITKLSFFVQEQKRIFEKKANNIIDTIVDYFDYMKIENNKQLTRDDFLDLNELLENKIFENHKSKCNFDDLESCEAILKELYLIAVYEVIFNKNKKFNKNNIFNRDQALKDLIY